MSDKLQQLCRQRVRVAATWGQGQVYRRLRLRSHWYDSFDLIWDAPTRIVLVARCWGPDALRKLREDVLHLHVTLPQLQIYKKIHLILFHARIDNASEQPWPSGLSFSAIALDPAKDLDELPRFVGPKLDTILGIPPGALTESEAAATGRRPPNWRLFLQNDSDIVLRKIKDLAGRKADLPTDLQPLVDRLLAMAEENAIDLEHQVTDFLNRLWEGRANASATPAP